MDAQQISSTRLVGASPAAVFAVLADPTTHASVDGTGWVSGALDREPIEQAGQVFRMAMFHEGHPDGNDEIANLVLACDPPAAIGWKPGVEPADGGATTYGGWTWRYDLVEVGPGQTEVTLTYDWSGATAHAREVLDFPPFPITHLERSLDHLADLADPA